MQEVCEEVTTAAIHRDIDPVLIASLSWEESRFRFTESQAGAVGPLQVLPQYWCPDGRTVRCNLIEAGLDAYESFADTWPNVEETLCHYNGGNVCGESSVDYADRILSRYQDLIDEIVDCHLCGC